MNLRVYVPLLRLARAGKLPAGRVQLRPGISTDDANQFVQAIFARFRSLQPPRVLSALWVGVLEGNLEDLETIRQWQQEGESSGEPAP